MPKYPIFRINDLVNIAKERQINRLDCLILWVGKRGSGKSTGSYKFCIKLKKKYFINHLGVTQKAGGFRAERDMVYTRDDMIKLLKRKYKVIDGDEMINAAYNREFAQGDQQALIKILNQYRSNYNIFSMCSPFFYDLDPDLRNLVSIRIDIIRKGVGIVHFPNDTLYSNDPWDTKQNLAIEKSWFKKGVYKPKYSQLTTFKGILYYGPMSAKMELKYERIRDLKRAAANPDNMITDEDRGVYNRIIDLLLEAKLNKESMENIFIASNIKYYTGCSKLNRILKDRKIGKTLGQLLKEAVIKKENIEKEAQVNAEKDEMGYIVA